MKKKLTLFATMAFALMAAAQEVDETFQFVDAQGNVIADGTTIVVNQLNEEGQMVIPLWVKNTSEERAAVGMFETIDGIPNGTWQTCAFGNCMMLTETGYSPKSIVPDDYYADIQTEWIPQQGQYATWEATLQIHVFNIDKQKRFGQIIESPGNDIIAEGPRVTVRFEYKDEFNGDVNGDSSVDVADISAVISIMAGTTVPGFTSDSADVNGDGTVDVADISAIISIMAGLVPDTTAIDSTDQFDPFTPQGRHVLVEDFTGQDCVNCPNATDLIAQLQDMYGHDRIIAVGIHSGPLGVKPSKDPEGLATDLGDTYYNYWNIEMQPYGVINRSDGTLPTDWWSAKVTWDLNEEQPDPSVNIWVTSSTGNDRKANIEVTVAAYEHYSGKLQLWLVEDNIVAFQKMPNGTTKNDYVHNHVLRDAVNGAWGEGFTIEADETKKFNYTYTLPAGWKVADMSIVAFAYNDDKVMQTTCKRLTINN